MRPRFAGVFKFAMPFLQASLIKQILCGLALGIILALVWPDAAKAVGLLGKFFVTALKGVAPVLVFILVISAIANQGEKSPVPESGANRLPIKSILLLYVLSTFGAAITSVAVSFLFPTKISLVTNAETVAAPGGITEVLSTLLLNVVDNPVHAIATGNYIGILAWALACGIVLRRSRPETRIVLTDATGAVEFVVRLVIRFAPISLCPNRYFRLGGEHLGHGRLDGARGLRQTLSGALGLHGFCGACLEPLLGVVCDARKPVPCYLVDVA